MLRSPYPALLLLMGLAASSGCVSSHENRAVAINRVASRDELPRLSELLRRKTTVAPTRPTKQLQPRPSNPGDESSATAESPPTDGQLDRVPRPNTSRPDTERESALTYELIESELRDALPKEREELRRELSGLDSNLVRQILRIRRRSLDEQQRQLAQSHNRPAKTTTGETKTPASARGAAQPSESPVTSRHTPPKLARPALSGLGITNPFSLSRQKSTEGYTPPTADARRNPPAIKPDVVTASAAEEGANAVQRANFVPQAPSPEESELTPGDPAAHATDPTVAPVAAPPATSSWKDSVPYLIALAEAEIQQLQLGATDAERQSYTEAHVQLRLLYLMAGRPQQALQAIPGLEPAEQEFWQQLLWGIAGHFDSQTYPDPADRATHTISQLAAAMQRLQQQSRLEIGNVTLCHKISGFGNYERFAKDEFSPGQPVLIYAEIYNFRSEVTPEGLSRTQLGSTIEIVKPGETEEVIERIPFPVTEDLCRTQRRDYFHSYEITLPQRLTTGPHVLRLTVEDQVSKKTTTTTLNFVVK